MTALATLPPRTSLDAAQVFDLLSEGCNAAEIGAYAGVRLATARAMCAQAVRAAHSGELNRSTISTEKSATAAENARHAADMSHEKPLIHSVTQDLSSRESRGDDIALSDGSEQATGEGRHG